MMIQLMDCDELQSGLDCAGKMLAVEHEAIRPDVINVLAKRSGEGFTRGHV